MKKLFLILFIGLLACSFFGCEIPPPPCKATKIQRPALSSDALQWVQVADTAPYFKVTSYDVSGNITSVDTLQGHYTYTLEDKQNFGNTECETIHYQEATNKLILKKGKSDLEATISVGNYLSNESYKGNFEFNQFDPSTVLDTVTIMGRKYENVLKIESGSNYVFYYAKGIGIIYRKISFKVELIP